MRISTKGRGIIKAQQGTVARPNPKENKDNPDRVNVQQQGFRGANVNMKDANGNYYIDPNRQLKGTDIQEMRTNVSKLLFTGYFSTYRVTVDADSVTNNAVCQSGVTTEIPINQAYIGGDTANISINVII